MSFHTYIYTFLYTQKECGALIKSRVTIVWPEYKLYKLFMLR